MTYPNHTYGPTCHLSRNVVSSGVKGDDVPPLKAQFFYSSPLPIDDPLTAIPAPSSSESKTSKFSPRPFSAYDNNALEEAWLGLASEKERKYHHKLKGGSSKVLTKVHADTSVNLDKDRDKPRRQTESTRYSYKRCKTCSKSTENCICGLKEIPLDRSGSRSDTPDCCSELERDRKVDKGKDVKRPLRKHGSDNSLIQDDLVEAEHQHSLYSSRVMGEKKDSKRAAKNQNLGTGQGDAADEVSTPAGENPSNLSSAERHGVQDATSERRSSKEHEAFEKHQEPEEDNQHQEHQEADLATELTDPRSLDLRNNKVAAPGSSDAGTTGFPFQRAPSRRNVVHSARSYGTAGEQLDGFDDCVDSTSSDSDETLRVARCKAHKTTHGYADVPVGVSRLHLVKLPALQMMPIYWSPVHDIAAVIRGTWFYKDTMYPVEPAVANQLEMGYRELRPWSQTWLDELKCALEVGATGEEKISHQLWPKDSEQKGNKMDACHQKLIATNPYCAARCFHGEVAAVGIVDANHPDEKTSLTTEITKRFPNSHVIYKDSHNAFILKPSLQPSEYYGRRPLSKIKKGNTVGIPVVRGFAWKDWEQLHPNKKSKAAAKAEEAAPVAGNADAGKRTACAACLKREERPKVTDLVLVIHGIGQKLSERVESFHFTHSINAFRRSVNVELGNDAVQNVLREDLGGIMVLPVNWRSNLSFEDGGPMTDRDKSKGATASDFTLKDITPDTIPAVRNLISDVMLDIPFYMSHHKPKMIEALITEANRVYRLWCQNNPEFDEMGRVHIIAHSLGSAMALDVLSKQPTAVHNVDLRKKMSTKHFEFDTKNLFLAGSPAGFFLLLEKGKLLPRKGRNKPGTQPGDDNGKDVTGDAGTFGCLAVDNLYNIVHYNDPIAYRLNGAVDPLYASTLKIAQVPSATTGWIEAIGNAMRSIKPGGSTTTELGVGQITKPSVARLPSQLEMEVHDFSREELAEKKFYLLNDNGQIDYFLSSGGGPLEFQYLNMLSAHSSYWISPDFVRMLVTEVGRKPGRSHTLPNMRVVKAGH